MEKYNNHKKKLQPKALMKVDKELKNKSKSTSSYATQNGTQGKGKKSKKNNSKKKKILKICFFVFLALVIIGTGVVVGVITGIIDKTDSIGLDDIQAYNLTSFVYNKNGDEIGKLYDSENRITIEYKDLPQHVVDAIVSIEDERFFTHKGVDVKRTLGAVVTYVFNGGKSNFGGSTITQQLVKNVTSDKESSWTRKIREWYRATVLETKMSKEDILVAYLNTIYMGDGAYGIEVASQNYFGKKIQDVNIAEAAVLAAIIQSPESTNPYKSEEAKNKLLDRQKIVLNQMKKLGKITEDEYNEACNTEIAFKKEQVVVNADIQSYYVDAVFEQVKKDLMEEKGVNEGVAVKMLYGDGLKIYTPQDSTVQTAIDNTFNNDKLFYTEKNGDFMQAAMVVIDQATGDVVGLSGGAGEKTGALQFNRATQARRQPGSCMKPLGAYGPAFEQGVSSPGAGLDDSPLPQGTWNPGNYYGYFNGYVTARDAIAKSMNLPAARANMKVDVSFAFNFAKNCGLKGLVSAKENKAKNDESAASLALGGVTKGFTPLEMANAYATIANGGLYIEPKLYTKVLDRNGKEILTSNSEAKRVMKDSTSYMLTSCLETVVKSGTGAGSIKATNGMPVAGKTGNTNDDKDQWFCGFTPYYTIACWNGYDDPRAIGYRKYGSYPYTSMKLFNSVVNEISKGQQVKQFERPSSVIDGALCRDSGLVATEACKTDPRGDRTLTDLLAKGSVPTATCTVHKRVKVCKDTGKLATEYCQNTEERSYISRDYDPPIKPSDWQYMVPKDKCDLHTANSVKNENNSDVKIYTESTNKNSNTH